MVFLISISVTTVPQPAHVHALSHIQRGAYDRTRQWRTERHAQTGAGARKKLPWCTAAFGHELVKTYGALGRRIGFRVRWGMGMGMRCDASLFVSASLCAGVGILGSAPVIHMGMIVGRRGVSIKIRPLEGEKSWWRRRTRGGMKASERVRGGENRATHIPHLKRCNPAIPVCGSALYESDWQTLPSPKR
jgi:hypothetical protein